jgi:accessory Sec system glycosylation protein GtfA
VVLIDRTTGIGQTILQNVGPARVGIIIHADHYSEGGTDAQNILWNNYYEYAFSQHRHIDFYVTATDAQNQLLRSQFASYTGVTPQVITIPVGSVDALKYPSEKREKHTLITASRLAGEKHIDWLVDAVVAAREAVPDLTLDIYGKGAEEEALRKQITEKQATGFIHLMGQHNLDEVYQRYDAYLSGSTSEGFGLTLLEAVAAGLPIIGFDVRYGNQTFIDHEANGYLIPVDDHTDNKERVQKLTACIIRLFTEADIEAFHQHSYEKAQAYLTTEVEKRWKEALEPATSCCS